MDLIQKSLMKAAAVTIMVLLIGLLAGLQMDDMRTGYVSNRISEASVNAQTIMAVQNYLDTSDNYCELVRKEIPQMGENNAEIGTSLEQFSSKGVSKASRYKLLRRRYYVSQLRLYNTIDQYRDRCRAKMDSILFFFDGDIASKRQGAVLTQYRKEVDNSTSIFSFNLAVDNSKVLEVLKSDFNVTGGPTIVINGNRTYRKYIPLKQLKNLMNEESTPNATA
ncbi:MAG: hypothetical protein ABEJ87_06105 [Candidatus Nanohalobium sp.]